MFDIAKTYSEHRLDIENIPSHVAMIMDGNGRWAKDRFLPRIAGHKKGAETVRLMVKLCVEFGVKYLSIYAFSTENWTRPKKEVEFLFSLFNQLIHSELADLTEQGVAVSVIGEKENLPSELIQNINLIEEKTAKNNRLHFQIMLNYGSRQEICAAVKKCMIDFKENKISLEELDDSLFSSYLYTNKTPDPDIVLRTSGELRLSNFLLWQSAYSEFVFTKKLWPEFDKSGFVDMVREYQGRTRRYGGVNS